MGDALMDSATNKACTIRHLGERKYVNLYQRGSRLISYTFRDLGILQTPEHSGNASMRHINSPDHPITFLPLCRMPAAAEPLFSVLRLTTSAHSPKP
jgi:hypothetical protein